MNMKTQLQLIAEELELKNLNRFEAISLLAKMLEDDPENGELMYILGKQYFMTFQYGRAIDLLLKVAKLDLDEPRKQEVEEMIDQIYQQPKGC